jgi:hypothetical protein
VVVCVCVEPPWLTTLVMLSVVLLRAFMASVIACKNTVVEEGAGGGATAERVVLSSSRSTFGLFVSCAVAALTRCLTFVFG